MTRSFVAGCGVLLMGCVSTPEVKQASASIGVSLAAVQDAQREFRDAFLEELDETRRLIGRAIVSSAVVAKVGTLAEQEAEGDLIAISNAIKGERDAYRSLVDQLMAVEPEPGDSAAAVVERFLAGQAAALRTSADELARLGAGEAAAELRQRALELESGDGVDQFGDMVSLVTLAQTKRAVREGVGDLQAYVELLQLIHATAHEWITTDVSIDGADVAGLIEQARAAQAGEGGGS